MKSLLKLIGLYLRINGVYIDANFFCKTDMAKLSLCLINTPLRQNIGDF
jgi:hypothetical protein